MVSLLKAAAEFEQVWSEEGVAADDDDEADVVRDRELGDGGGEVGLEVVGPGLEVGEDGG